MWQREQRESDFQAAPEYVATAASTEPYAIGNWDSMPEVQRVWPPSPRTVEEVGIPPSFLEDLVLKTLYYRGPSPMESISKWCGLAFEVTDELLQSLKASHLIEVGSGSRLNEMGFKYKLMAKGEERATDALERSRYTSAAPVPLEQYVDVVRRQSIRSFPQEPALILQALSELVLNGETVDNLARALHSGRSTLIFGPSGNGKTTILEQYARYTNDSIIIPHSLYVYGQIVRVYDAAVHQAIEPEMEAADDYGLFKPKMSNSRFDQRWIEVRRPVVVVGGELTQEGLELSFDPMAHFYQAPPHIKAQDGVFVIDDFGRQRVRPEELLNRWIMPMERGFDMLTLHTGETFTVPFEMALMFSTNLRPADLVDEAFLRRIAYKVEVPCPSREEFREITRRVAAAKGMHYTESQLDYFIDKVYSHPIREPKGAYPRDIILAIIDGARFDGTTPEFTADLVDRAMRVYFVD